MGRFSKLELGQDKAPPKAAARRRAEEISPAARPEEDVDAHGNLRRGTDLLLQGQSQEALRRFGRAIHLDSTLLDAWAGQIDALIELGQTREAEVWASRALAQFPDDPTLLSLRATLLARQGMHRRAIGASDYALSRGHTLRAWIARAEVLLAANSSNAPPCLEKTLAEIPEGDWENLVRVGMVLLRHRRHAQALDVFQRACAAQPGHAPLWLRVAACHERLGFTERAIEACERALEIDPGNREVENALHRFAHRGPLARVWRWITGRR